jgi:predicted RNA-binding Zn ribbon-like protein
METSYPGPLRDEPLAVELHNTLYAVAREPFDGLETVDGLKAWLVGIRDRLPAAARDADPARRAAFLDLRAAVRDALHAAVDGAPVPGGALEVLNAAAAAAPASVQAVGDKRGRPRAELDYHGADSTEIALAALAADAIELITSPSAEQLRACEAPGCVLMFAKDHPRRRWCSAACGNRARQARHYEQTRYGR